MEDEVLAQARFMVDGTTAMFYTDVLQLGNRDIEIELKRHFIFLSLVEHSFDIKI